MKDKNRMMELEEETTRENAVRILQEYFF